MSSDEEEDNVPEAVEQPVTQEENYSVLGDPQLSQQENMASNSFNLTLIPPPYQNPNIPYPRVEAPVPQNLYRQYFPFNGMRGMTQFQSNYNAPTGRHSAPTLPTLPPLNQSQQLAAAPKEDAKKKQEDGKKKQKKKAPAKKPPAKKPKTQKKGPGKKAAPKQQASSAMPTGGAGGAGLTQGGGSTTYTDAEIEILLDLIQQYLPIGNIAWMRVVDEYNRRVPTERARNKTSILKRFNTLHQRLMPTGDPNMPDDVRRAKHLNYLIMDKSECVNMNGDDLDLEEDDAEIEEELVDPVVALREAEGTKVAPPAITGDVTTAAIRPVPSSISTGTGITSSRTSRAQNKRAKSEADKVIEAFVKIEQVHLRREKAKDKQNRQQMQAFMGLIGGALTAFMNSNANGDGQGRAFANIGANLFGESSESDEGSSICTLDSPPTVRIKLARGKKQKKKKNSGTVTGDDEHDEEE
jgi:hypothetical protein